MELRQNEYILREGNTKWLSMPSMVEIGIVVSEKKIF
jgi:hypothetical protein